MLIRTPLYGWIALYVDGCERYCESRGSDRAWEFVERIISDGPIHSSGPRDCSACIEPGSWRANPDEETTDWRAVCGRTARTVRRAGTAKAVSDPYRTSDSQQSWRSKLRGIDLNENKKQIRRDSTDQLRVLIREITDRAMHMKLQINIDVDDLEGGEAFY